MNAVRYVSLLGLVGLLTGCVTPTDMGYVVPAEPVHNTSPAYYATPVSGYSTMTVYDGYHPGYGGSHYPHPHHRPPPPHGNRPPAYGGHGDHGGHGGHHGGRKSAMHSTNLRLNPGGNKRTSVNNSQPSPKKQSPKWRPSGKGGASGKGGGRKK